MSEDLTLYDVLGVDSTADKDAIKAAYQTRLAEVQGDVQREQGAKKPDQGSIDGYRREEASVRGAWQVLSDPYQRGRYDATMELGGPGGGDDVDEDDDDAPVPVRSNARPAPRQQAVDRRGRPIRERPPSMFSAAPLPTPESWPAGFHPPPPRARSLAMLIDLFVLATIFIVGAFFAGPAILDKAYPKERHQLELVNDCRDRLKIEQDRDPQSAKHIANAEAYCINHGKVELASASKRENRGKQARLDDDVSRSDDRATTIQGKMTLGSVIYQFGLIAAMLLYLVPSSVRSGRTFGKRLFQIRVVYVNGAPLTTRGAVSRFGSIVLASMFLGSFVPPLGFILPLFGVLAWPRNPNLQGLHDRIAKTIVVDG